MSTLKTQVKRHLLAVLAVVTFLSVAGQGVAHATANPLLSNQAGGSGFAAGSQIYDSATLGSGANPTGSLTFKLFGPEDPTCAGSPLFTTTTAVNGNGYYESSRFTTNAAGTYRWTAVYGGDANNNPSAATACSDPAAQANVAKRVPVLNSSATSATTSAVNTAVLTMGAGATGPGGTMTFNLYGPNNMTCAGAPIFTSTRSVAGNSTYPSTSYSPAASGNYQWVVIYSGDANNAARSTMCSDPGNAFTSSGTPSTAGPTGPGGEPTVSGSSSIVSRGGTITVTWSGIDSPTDGDWVALYAATAADGGAVTAWKYTGGSASGSVNLKFPWGAAAGGYEIRLLADNNIGRLATSSPITLVW